MSKNFSAPKSAPKPASVTTYGACFKAILIEVREEQPWAILAKGPPWTKARLPSRVWTALELMASFKIIARASVAHKSWT